MANAPGPSGPAPGRTPAVTVPAGPPEVAWRQQLDRDISARQVAVTRQVSIDLATIHVRCVRELGSGRGVSALPAVLDRELHALSVRATRLVDASATAISRRIFGTVLATEPDAALLDRIRRALRRAVDAGRPDGSERERVLLLTATSGVAVSGGPGAAAALAAVPPHPTDEVLPPVAVGLTATSYQLWQHKTNADKKDSRVWLQQAIRVIEGELERELTHRFTDLREALTAVAGDTVDHGVLLA
jgi:hypothetical protein